MHHILRRYFSPILYIIIFFAGFLCACVLFNPHDYLADASSTLSALATAAVLVLAYLFCYLSLKHRHHSTSVVAGQPAFYAQWQNTADNPRLIEFMLHNNGRGNAYLLNLHAAAKEPTPAAEKLAEALNALKAFQPSHSIGLTTGECYGGVFADWRELTEHFTPQTFQGVVEITVNCRDAAGNNLSDTLTLFLATLAERYPIIDLKLEKRRKPILY